jgi:hypothetical protein
MKQMREDLHAGFTAQDASIAAHFAEFSLSGQQREERVATLETAAVCFDKALNDWKPEVDSSIAIIKLELSKLNTFFDHEAKAAGTPQAGILTTESTGVRTSSVGAADGPAGHRVDINHRDCGFRRVFPQIRDPVKGTVHPSPLPSNFPSHVESSQAIDLFHPSYSVGQGSRVPLGKFPKVNFPKFEGYSPKLWQSRENYFEMYGVDPSVWVRVSTMHFEGPAARWLQSVNRRVLTATWKELCMWIHERFGRDQHDLLIRQLFHIKQTSSVQEYIDRFSELVDQLLAYDHSSDYRYYIVRFVDGLKDDVKSVVLVQRPLDLNYVCTLTLLQEEAYASRRREFKKPDYLFKSKLPS